MRTAKEKKPAAAGRHTTPFFDNSSAENFFGARPEPNTFFQKSYFPLIQPKLAIGQTNDKYEKEADAVAQTVVSSSDPTLQAKCAECEKEESLQKQSLSEEVELQMQPMEEEEDILQTQSMEEEEDLQIKPSLQLKDDAASAGRTEASPWIQSRINSSRGCGRPLDGTTRSFMENRMQTDFSSVNIHTGDESVQMNRELGARAITVGSDVYFNKGEYRPETTEGKKLLAHELTHTVQQNGNKLESKNWPKTPKKYISKSFISRQTQPTRQQQTDERRLRRKISMAISLLQNAAQHLATPAQAELLNEILNTFSGITPAHIGILDENRRRLRSGRPLRLLYTFRTPGQMSRPFMYHIRFDLSHETSGAASGYFRGPSNYGGFIVVKVSEARSASVDDIAKLLVHEAVHMFAHVQRAVNARIGPQGASMVPGQRAATIIDTSSLTSHKQAFRAHFNRVRTFLNAQSHRRLSFNKFPASVVDDWTRQVIEESIAYVFQSRVDMAISRSRTAGTSGPTVNMASGFVPLQFLRNYLTRHWLTEPDDQAAMATQQGRTLLKAMSSDMTALHQAVENQVGPY